MFKIHHSPFEIALKHTFTLADSSRKSTPAVLLEIRWDDWIGYGEATLPPRFAETQTSVSQFLRLVDLSSFTDPNQLDEMLDYIQHLTPGENRAAKAALDIALHDLWGKRVEKNVGERYLKGSKALPPFTSYTIGIDSEEIIRQKVQEAASYKVIKVKLGCEQDKEIIETIRSITDKPLCVDANQGWTTIEQALEMTHWLEDKNVLFIEQPMPKELTEEAKILLESSVLPIIADEFIQDFDDIARCVGHYDGINIKLMKCGGIREAYRMIEEAKHLGLKVMLGCMTETSCAISAAAHLSPLVDWVDLDGNLLISNDPFDGPIVIGGRVWTKESAGLGIELKTWRI